jgi:hypothetical protein
MIGLKASQRTHLPGIGWIRLWWIALVLVTSTMTIPQRALCQVIRDFSETFSDVVIVGATTQERINRIEYLDFNGNGLNDLFVGGKPASPTGRIYCYLDRPLHRNMTIDLLTEEPDLLIYGDYGINLGIEILRCDINTDGIDDLALNDRRSQEATVYVLFGSSEWHSGMEVNLSTDEVDLKITGAHTATLGWDMTSADVNGDGREDLIVGAYNALNGIGWSTGAVFVFFAGPQYTSPMTIDLASQPADITILGADGNDNLGQYVTTGDVNGDGLEDMIIGAYTALYSGDMLGRIYIFFGRPDWSSNRIIDLATETADLTILGPTHGSALGGPLASGDFNGDGIDDILCGARYAETTPSFRGVSYVIYGRSSFSSGDIVDLRSEAADLTCLGERYYNLLGQGMSAGDLDGDGMAEWVVTSGNVSGTSDPDGTGRGYVIAGSNSFPANHVIDFSIHEPTVKILSMSDGAALGVYHNGAQDLDGDGLDDLVLGTPGADMEGRSSCGMVHVIFGGFPLNNPPRVVAGPGPHAANRAEVRLYDPFHNRNWRVRAFPFLVQGYGMKTAAGDVDGDGYDQVIVGPGPGPYHPPQVAVLDEEGELEYTFLAYGTKRFGVNVTAGDLDGDGRDEIITGAGPGEVFGPHVRGWRFQDGAMAPLPGASFFAYGTLRWGVNLTAGDLDGDGREEIVTGAGPGDVFGPHVRAWRYQGGAVQPVQQVSFLAYGTNRYGVNVACGDIDGDGLAEIVTGPGPSELFASHVRGWNYDGEALAEIEGVNFIAHPEGTGRGGVIVACGNIDNDGYDEILTAPGPMEGNLPRINSWNFDGEAISLIESKSFGLFDEWGDDEYVAGANIALGNFFEPADYLP